MKIYDNIVGQSKIRFSTPVISDEAKDFVFKLLKRDPKERLAVDEALQHPWIINCGKSTTEIIPSTIKSLVFFNARRKVSKALQTLADSKVNEYDETWYINQFKQFDTDGNGHISKEECVAGLQLSMVYPKEAERLATEIFETANLNNDEQLQYKEFKNSMALKGLSNDEYRIHAIFTALDENRDGKISVTEYTNCLPQGDDGEADELVAAFREADENKDDYVTFEEFKRILNFSEKRIRAAFKFLEPEEVSRVIHVDGQNTGKSLSPTKIEEVELELVNSKDNIANLVD